MKDSQQPAHKQYRVEGIASVGQGHGGIGQRMQSSHVVRIKRKANNLSGSINRAMG